MGLLTGSDLARFFNHEPYDAQRIDDVVDSGDALYLGQVGLSKTEPMARFGFWFGISDSARFFAITLDAAETGVSGMAIVFHRFDDNPYTHQADEHLAGWVLPEHASAAEQWVSQFNQEIARLLALKHARLERPLGAR